MISCILPQALTWSRIEAQYHSINEYTVGIFSLATPHRGSENANYGTVLSNLATWVMNKPTPRLINALRSNSDALLRLTSEFKFELPRYMVASFHEMRPIRPMSTLVSVCPRMCFESDDVCSIAV